MPDGRSREIMYRASSPPMLWAMMLTAGGVVAWPSASALGREAAVVCARMSAASLAARSSIEPDGGTVAVMTVQLFAVRACLMPFQYSIVGRSGETLSSEKPNRP